MKKMFLIMMIALFSLNMGIYAQQNAKAYDIVDVMPIIPRRHECYDEVCFRQCEISEGG